MPYLINTSIYPSEKAPEVTKKFFEVLKKYPPDKNLGDATCTCCCKGNSSRYTSDRNYRSKGRKTRGSHNACRKDDSDVNKHPRI